MLLIADSGATKTAWVLLDKQKQKIGEYFTMGFSPMFHDSPTIFKAIQETTELMLFAEKVKQVHYFGAGCSSSERCAIVDKALASSFKNAQITVEHDLLASAVATCGDNNGIACILGTGSNSCYYEGKTRKLYEEIPSLDYVLGDEGSGSWFGKKLIANYLYKRLPKDLSEQFSKNYPDLNKEQVLTKVYRQAHPKVFLASFMPFVHEHRLHPYMQKFLLEGFADFIAIHVCIFSNHKTVPIHFVGSISHYFQAELKKAIEERNLILGRIIKNPIDGLVSYFQNK